MAQGVEFVIRLKSDGNLRVELERARESLRRVSATGRRAGRELDAGFSRARRGAESVSRQLERARNALAGFLSFKIGSGIARDLFRVAADMEGVEAALRAVSGGSREAAEALAFVRSEADRLGLPLASAARQFAALTAAARGTALEGGPVREIFTALSEAAVVLQLSNEDLAGAFTAVEQIISKGKVSAEELRGQLGERLYGAFQIAARSIGVATSELDEFLARGRLASEEFLVAFARQLRRDFGQSVPEASRTALRELNRFNNALLELKLQVAGGGFLEAVTKGLRQAAEALSRPGLAADMERFGGALGKLITLAAEHGGTLLRVLGALAGAKLAGGLAKLAKNPLLGALLRLGGAGAGALAADSLFPGSGGGGGRGLSEEARLRKEIARLRKLADEREKLLSLAGRRERARLERHIAALRAKAKEKERILQKLVGAKGPAADGGGRFLGERLRARDGGGAARVRVEGALRVELEAISQAERALADSLRRREIAIADYQRRREALVNRAVDAEIEARRRLIEIERKRKRKRDGAAGRIGALEAEIALLERQRAGRLAEVRREAAAAERDYAEAIARVRDRLAELSGGPTLEAIRERLKRGLREVLEAARAQGDAGAAREVERLIDLSAMRERLEGLQEAARGALERMRAEIDGVNQSLQAGLTTEAAAREKILEIQKRAREQVRRMLPEMKQLAGALGDPALVARVERLGQAVLGLGERLSDAAGRLKDSLQQAFSDFFYDFTSGARSMGEAFADFGRSVLATMQRIISDRIARQFADLLFGKAGGAAAGGGGGGGSAIGGAIMSGIGEFFTSFLVGLFHTGGVAGQAPPARRRVPALAFAGAPRYHGGGLAGLAPDEVPAILKRGEEVITRGDPRHRFNEGGAPQVTMIVQTPDAESFRRSRDQILQAQREAQERAATRNG